MTSYPEAAKINELIGSAQRIVIIQADNPDGDSMGSALALEEILGDLGKDVYLYCGADIPSYLRYLEGWSRINKTLPSQFDLSIIVDTSADSLLENMELAKQKSWVKSKPLIVLDHHLTEATIDYATVMCNKPAVAAAEVIYELSQQLDWPLNANAKNMITVAIMSDSLGLTTDATSARSIAIISELVAGGVSIPHLEEKRRDTMRKSPELVKYKGELLQRIEYYNENQIAVVTIPWEEIETYSPQYNPSMLVIDDMRMTIGTRIAISFKYYNDDHITAKVRANLGTPIAAKLAEHFGGGGHAYASGFKKYLRGRPFNEIKSECIEYATKLIQELEQENSDETLQHTDA